MSHATDKEHDLLPYRDTTDPDYAQRAADHNFALDLTQPGSPLLRGHCPRCYGSMTFLLVDDLYKSVAPADQQSPSPPTDGEPEDSEPVICTCKGEHPGRPAGEEGCGAYWRLRVRLKTQ